MAAALPAAALGALLALLPSPGRADWLVTREGARIETEGPWTVRGQVVVFTRAEGGLASLQLQEVDLAASEAATAEALAPAPAPAVEEPPPPREPVLVLTDADVGKARRRRAPAPPEAVEAGGEDGTPAAAASAVPLEVVSWTETTPSGTLDLEVLGTLRNNSDQVASEVRVTVQAWDSNRELLAATEARLGTSALPPGATTNFRATLPGVVSFAELTFEPAATHLRFQAPPAGETEEDG